MDSIFQDTNINGGLMRVIYGESDIEIWVDEENLKGIGRLPSGALPASMGQIPKLVFKKTTKVN